MAEWASEARQAVGICRGAVVKPRTPQGGCPQACPVGRWLVHGGRVLQQTVTTLIELTTTLCDRYI